MSGSYYANAYYSGAGVILHHFPVLFHLILNIPTG
jgi:hypothetical protein